MNALERKVSVWGLFAVTVAVAALWTLKLQVTAFSTLSYVTVFSPLGVPMLVVWGLLVGAAWDRLLRGPNVSMPKPFSFGVRHRLGVSLARVRNLIGIGALALTFTMSSSGCAAGYKAVYGASATTKEFVTQEQDEYSRDLNKGFVRCDPRLNPESTATTWEELDECLGDGYTYEEVQLIRDLMKDYYDAATRLSELMSNTTEKGRLLSAFYGLLTTARAVIDAMPDSAAKLEELQSLVGRLAR